MLTFIGVVVVAVIAFKLFMLFFSSSESAVERATRKYMGSVPAEGEMTP